MSNTERIRVLDVGGGTDSHPDLINQSTQAKREYFAMQELRAVKLARRNPDGHFFVVDPNISTEQANRITLENPNVGFFVGSGDSIPSPDDTFDVVELNHLFYPICQANVYEREASIEDDVAHYRDRLMARSNSMFDGRRIDEKVSSHRQALEKELLQLVESNDALLEGEDPRISDFGRYFKILQESARATKPGGELTIAEKRSRINIILGALRTPEGQQFLATHNLTIGSLEVNTDPDRSAYAEVAGQATVNREANTPLILRLTKGS